MSEMHINVCSLIRWVFFFYKIVSVFCAVSKSVKSPGIKYMFQDLAKEELEHKEKLELELMKLGEVVHPEEEHEETLNP